MKTKYLLTLLAAMALFAACQTTTPETPGYETTTQEDETIQRQSYEGIYDEYGHVYADSLKLTCISDTIAVDTPFRLEAVLVMKNGEELEKVWRPDGQYHWVIAETELTCSGPIKETNRNEFTGWYKGDCQITGSFTYKNITYTSTITLRLAFDNEPESLRLSTAETCPQVGKPFLVNSTVIMDNGQEYTYQYNHEGDADKIDYSTGWAITGPAKQTGLNQFTAYDEGTVTINGTYTFRGKTITDEITLNPVINSEPASLRLVPDTDDLDQTDIFRMDAYLIMTDGTELSAVWLKNGIYENITDNTRWEVHGDLERTNTNEFRITGNRSRTIRATYTYNGKPFTGTFRF